MFRFNIIEYHYSHVNKEVYVIRVKIAFYLGVLTQICTLEAVLFKTERSRLEMFNGNGLVVGFEALIVIGHTYLAECQNLQHPAQFTSLMRYISEGDTGC